MDHVSPIQPHGRTVTENFTENPGIPVSTCKGQFRKKFKGKFKRKINPGNQFEAILVGGTRGRMPGGTGVGRQQDAVH